MPFQRRGIGQKTRRDREPLRAARRIGCGLVGHLARSGRRSEMRRHPIDAPGLKTIAHQSSPLACVRASISRRAKPLQNRRIQVLDEKTSSTLTGMRKLPPLRALHAFEAATRLLSFPATLSEL